MTYDDVNDTLTLMSQERSLVNITYNLDTSMYELTSSTKLNTDPK